MTLAGRAAAALPLLLLAGSCTPRQPQPAFQPGEPFLATTASQPAPSAATMPPDGGPGDAPPAPPVSVTVTRVDGPDLPQADVVARDKVASVVATCFARALAIDSSTAGGTLTLTMTVEKDDGDTENARTEGALDPGFMACVRAEAMRVQWGATPHATGMASVVATPDVAPAAPPVAPSDGPRHFRVRVEQDGADVPIVAHRVAIARRAFTLVFELADVDLVSVNASYASHTLDLARRGAPLAALDSVFGVGHGAAEAEKNPTHDILVDDEAFDLWGWSKDVQRCHVHETPQGAHLSVCKRIVETLDHAGTGAPVARSTAAALYVVVMSTRTNTTTFTQTELARDWLTIAFQP